MVSKFNTNYIGAVVGVDNIEVVTNTGLFYHAWIQKNFFADSLSVLFGLYPIDSEFYVTESSDLFLQPTLQGVFNTGLDPTIDDAWIVGTRVELAL